MTHEAKYPEVKVKLVGEDGNVFAIVGRVKQAMVDAHVPQEAIGNFMMESMAGDYDHVLQTVAEYVTIEHDEPEDEDDDDDLLDDEDEDDEWEDEVDLDGELDDDLQADEDAEEDETD